MNSSNTTTLIFYYPHRHYKSSLTLFFWIHSLTHFLNSSSIQHFNHFNPYTSKTTFFCGIQTTTKMTRLFVLLCAIILASNCIGAHQYQLSKWLLSLFHSVFCHSWHVALHSFPIIFFLHYYYDYVINSVPYPSFFSELICFERSHNTEMRAVPPSADTDTTLLQFSLNRRTFRQAIRLFLSGTVVPATSQARPPSPSLSKLFSAPYFSLLSAAAAPRRQEQTRVGEKGKSSR